MRTGRLIPKVMILCFLSTAVLATTAVEMFQRSQVSDTHVSYRGMKTVTLSCQGGPTTAVFKVIHLRPSKTRTDYFAPEVLSGVIVIQDGPVIWRYSPSQSSWRQLHCPNLPLQATLSQEALENFDLRLVGSDRLAGRPVYVIYAVPKCPGEAARRLWIDRENYVVMGTQVESPSGRVVNKSQFTKIEFNPANISPSIFKISGKIEEPAKPAQPASFKVLKPTYIPAGYRLIGMGSLTIQQLTCVHLQYSNGVSTISLFERKADPEPIAPRVDGKLLNVYTWTRGGIHFTLIGSVPRSELRRMAGSLP